MFTGALHGRPRSKRVRHGMRRLRLSPGMAGAVMIASAIAAAPADATFTQEPGARFAADADPYWVVARDFTGDGLPDIAVVNGTSSTIIIGRRQPGGGFVQPNGGYGATSGPNNIVSADFNKDSKPDLALTGF